MLLLVVVLPLVLRPFPHVRPVHALDPVQSLLHRLQLLLQVHLRRPDVVQHRRSQSVDLHLRLALYPEVTRTPRAERRVDSEEVEPEELRRDLLIHLGGLLGAGIVGGGVDVYIWVFWLVKRMQWALGRVASRWARRVLRERKSWTRCCDPKR